MKALFRHLVLLLVLLASFTSAGAQGWHSFDSLVASTGFIVHLGQTLKLGAGNGPDGSFKAVRVRTGTGVPQHEYTRYTYHNGGVSTDKASKSMAGTQVEVIGFYHHRSTRTSKTVTQYVLVVFPVAPLISFKINLEAALKNGELLPVYFGNQPTSPQTSISNELSQLYKLREAGGITVEEYDTLKARMISQQGKTQ